MMIYIPLLTCWFFLVIFISTEKLSLTGRKKLQFYQKILNETKAKEWLSISHDQDHYDKIHIRTDKALMKDSVIFNFTRDHLICSCEFFPYKDTFAAIFLEFIKLNPVDNPGYVTSLFSLVYQLLYHKLGDFKGIRQAFRDSGHYSSEFFHFEMRSKQREYLEIISLADEDETEKMKALYFSPQIVKLLERLKFQVLIREISDKIFLFVKNSVENKLKWDKREKMTPFVSNYEYFILFTDYVYMNSYPIAFKEYFELLKGSVSEEEVFQYNKELEKWNYPSKVIAF